MLLTRLLFCLWLQIKWQWLQWRLTFILFPCLCCRSLSFLLYFSQPWFFCTPLITLVMLCFITIYLLFHPTLVTDSLSSPATLCCLQSALRGSTGTAAASRVHSVCTAPGHAIMSRATVSACLALPARCATKASSLLCPFDLYPALSRTVKFIHCEVWVFFFLFCWLFLKMPLYKIQKSVRE